ncbi:MAG: SagB/ThcOx family dehydrogenase [Candidatus Aenigmatarchaeota archaeon]|nr:MAG: SagB/ThcOx family dehydrogenase [Candidatus Aenigmarchaeota archaeon]
MRLDEGGRLLLEDFISKRAFRCTDRLIDMLVFCHRPRNIAEIRIFMKTQLGLRGAEGEQFLRELIEKDIIRPGAKDERALKAFSMWKGYNWREPFLHNLLTRDYPFVERGVGYSEMDKETMINYTKKSKMPNAYKEYKGVLKIRLPPCSTELGMFHEAIEGKLSRKSERMTLTSLSDILFYTFGKVAERQTLPWGKYILKTSPSGGARHPTEAYVYASEVSGLKKGIYHYSVKDHALEVLDGVRRETLEAAIPETTKSDTKAIVFLTSLFARNMWRYREPRTFRTLFFDAGHVIQTLQLVTESRGFDVELRQPFSTQKLESCLGLDMYAEGAISYAVIK